jgi:hypothetical protein
MVINGREKFKIQQIDFQEKVKEFKKEDYRKGVAKRKRLQM